MTEAFDPYRKWLGFEHNEGLGVAWAEWHWALLDGGARGEQIVPPEALYHDPEAWEETAGIMRRP